jgi:predicted NUDIX family NTP pyrophosphohydrolase
MPAQRRASARKRSAGLLLYKLADDEVMVLLVHPGGPFWARKDLGAWSIPKGEYAEGDDALEAARREFAEETGHEPAGPFLSLGEIVQAGGKRVVAWAVRGEFDPGSLVSNRFEIEWPPRSGRMQSFPEVDAAAWFPPDEARRRLIAAQTAFVDRLLDLVAHGS